MLIGIDAKRLKIKNRSGTQNYLYQLVTHLAQIDKVNKYVIYFDYMPEEESFSQLSTRNANFSFKYLKKSLSWTQVSLALECVKNPPDVLLVPWQTMPIVHSSKTKVISVIHDLDYSVFRFGPALYTCLFSNHIVAVSEFTKKAIQKKFGIAEKKISMVYEGVDLTEFYKRELKEITYVKSKYKITGDYVLFVSFMVARKNIKNMLRAFAKLVKTASPNYDKLTFVLAGKVSKECNYLYDLPKKLGIQDKVVFTGFVDQKDLPALISGAKLLAYVSLSEGFGLPALEAMACGTPVLTTRTGALPEVAGTAGVLVNPKSIAEITEGMTKLLSDTALINRLTEAGFKNVQRFSWNQTAENFLKVVIKNGK